jgi:hypothetical protein
MFRMQQLQAHVHSLIFCHPSACALSGIMKDIFLILMAGAAKSDSKLFRVVCLRYLINLLNSLAHSVTIFR